MSIDRLIEAIAEQTAEAIRDYEIFRSIEEIRTDTSQIISEILRG